MITDFQLENDRKDCEIFLSIPTPEDFTDQVIFDREMNDLAKKVPQYIDEVRSLQKTIAQLRREAKAMKRALEWLSETGWGVKRPKWLLKILDGQIPL